MPKRGTGAFAFRPGCPPADGCPLLGEAFIRPGGLPAPKNFTYSGTPTTSSIVLTWTDPVWPASQTLNGIFIFQLISGAWTAIATGAGAISPGLQTATVGSNLNVGANQFYIQGEALSGKLGKKVYLTVTITAVAPSITSQPSDLAVGLAATGTVAITATGTPPLTYQWQVSTGGAYSNVSNGGSNPS